MNARALAAYYDRLTSEERFRLLVAAEGRGDESERERLSDTGGEVTRTLPDHAAQALAFAESALLAALATAEEAAYYHDALARADELHDDPTPGVAERALALAHAAGYRLRLHAAGWTQFCLRYRIAPWRLWAGLPGCDRWQRALALAEQASFDRAAFLAWRERVRPADAGAGEPPTPEQFADTLEASFRERVAWWGG